MLEHSRQKNLLIFYVLSNLCCYMQRNQIIAWKALGGKRIENLLVQKIERLEWDNQWGNHYPGPIRRRIQQKKRKNLGTWLTKSIGHKRQRKYCKKLRERGNFSSDMQDIQKSLTHFEGLQSLHEGSLQKCNRQNQVLQNRGYSLGS